jgi:hypothetical protein
MSEARRLKRITVRKTLTGTATLRCRECGHVSTSTAEDEDAGPDLQDGQGRALAGDPGQGDQSAHWEAVLGKNVGICRVGVPEAAADLLLDHLRFPRFQLSYKHPQ